MNSPTYQVYLTTGLGHGYADPRLRAGDYDKIAGSYRAHHGRFLNWVGARGQAALSGAVASPLEPNLKVLDAGCGNGDLGREIAAIEPACDIEFLDASAQMLRQVPVGLGKKTLGSVTEIPNRSSVYDIAVCSFVLECLEEPEKAIGELVRVTKNGGHVCFAFCAESTKLDLPTRLIQFCMALSVRPGTLCVG